MTIGLHAQYKEVLGFEFDAILISFDTDFLRTLDPDDFEVIIGIAGGISAGASMEVLGGLSITGSDGSVLDQSGFDVIASDGVNINLSGCLPDRVCGGGGKTFEGPLETTSATSISYMVGVGEGIDASVDLVSASDWFFYANGSTDDMRIQVPIFNSVFINSIWERITGLFP